MSRELRLRRPLADHIRRGHPWVYREALHKLPACKPGDFATLRDEDGAFLAHGTVDPTSPLTFRVWSLVATDRMGQQLLDQRLRAAYAARQELLPADVTGYRVCHGENDHLPGMHCDLYDTIASIRTDGNVGAAWEARYVEAVKSVIQPTGIIVRNTQDKTPRIVHGEVPVEVQIQEGDRRFVVNLHHGQKTGFFLDQRDNRTLVGRISRNRRVLNLFSYTGGFSVAAALGGASRVVSVDIAAPAIEDARRNFALNGLDPEAHGFEATDAFDVAAAVADTPGQYDLIVLDPPSFASSRKNVPRAEKAYLALNKMALQGLETGGWLATASCSSHISRDMFLEIVTQAARETGRRVTVVGVHGAGADHPIRLGFPQGAYLKFILLRVGA